VVIDSVTDVAACLAAAETAQCGTVILKVNARELCKLAGAAEAAVGAAVDPAVQRAAAASLLATASSSAYIATTDGPHPAFLFSAGSGRSWQLPLPALSFPVRNPIGAGDAVAAGTINFLCGLVDAGGSEDREHGDERALAAFRWGLACGAASCASNTNSEFDLAAAVDIFRRITPTTYEN